MKKILLTLAIIVFTASMYSCKETVSNTNAKEAKAELPTKLWNISIGESVDSVIQMLESKHISYDRGLEAGDFFSLTASGEIPFENTLFDRAHIYFNLDGCVGVIIVKEFNNKHDASKLFNAISTNYTSSLKPLLTVSDKSDYIGIKVFKESSMQFKVIMDSTSNYISVAPLIEVPSFNVSVCLIDTLAAK